MKCPKCGKELVDNAKFCDRCGTKIESSYPVNEDSNSGQVSGSNISQNSNAGVQKDKSKFVWKEQYTYILIAVAAVIAVGAGLAVRASRANSSGKQETEYVAATTSYEEIMAADASEDAISFETESTDESEYEQTDTEAEAESESETETFVEEEPEKESTYQYVVKDVSWNAAKKEAEAAGGHLAVITSEDEYNTVCDIANESGLTYIWLGARIYSTDDSWDEQGWITGEEWTYDNWYPNEPSKIDTGDNVEELYLCMWKVKYNDSDIGWTFNDQREDIVADFPTISGKIGYIIEFEE